MASTIRRPRFQFSLAACLIVMTLIGIVIGRASHEARQQSLLVKQVERYGGRLTFQDRSSLFASLALPLRGVINPEYVRQVVGVDLRHKSAPLEVLEVVGQCPELRSLDLRACGVRDNGVALLRQLRKLESLDLSLNRISDASLPLIGQMSGLRHLELSQNKIGDAQIEHLAKLPRLLSLCLDQSQIGNDAMLWIGRMTSLQNLEIAETSVTDDGVQDLHSLRELTRLRIGGAGSITDRALSQLRDLPALSHLSLVDLQLSDESLIRFVELRQLRHLSLENGEATYRLSAVNDLKRLRPDLDVQQTVTPP